VQDMTIRRWPARERGSGKPVVLLHGYPLTHAMWQPQLESLSTSHRVVALDLPGFGLAEEWDVPTTLAGFAESVHRTLAEELPDPMVVVGHSFGGYVALQMYHDHPERFAGLVLANTRSEADTTEARAKRWATIERLNDPLEHLDVEASVQGLLAPQTWERRDPLVDTVRAMVGSARRQTVRAALQAIAERPDLTPVLATLRVPALVLWGEVDHLIPPAQSQAMVARIRDGMGMGIPYAGHLPSLESPEAFSHAVRELLAWADRSPMWSGTVAGSAEKG
jgi:3-oxoadipate enol-lactonase